MSRSRRHTPITGMTTCPSEKFDKARDHRQQRVHERVAIATGAEVIPAMPRGQYWGKDGRIYWGQLPDEYPWVPQWKLMRK